MPFSLAESRRFLRGILMYGRGAHDDSGFRDKQSHAMFPYQADQDRALTDQRPMPMPDSTTRPHRPDGQAP
jgi:hypothetical protein